MNINSFSMNAINSREGQRVEVWRGFFSSLQEEINIKITFFCGCNWEKRGLISNIPDMFGTILKCPAESSSTAGHFVPHWSMWRKCLAQKTKAAGHFQVAKCPAGKQNVCQSTESLLDILSGTPEIILIITELVKRVIPFSEHFHISLSVLPDPDIIN